jgi:hypothetical protein
MKFSTTAAAALALMVGDVLAAPTYGAKGCPEGFVYTEGSMFMLDGEPFLFAGSNAYWFPFINVSLHILLPLLSCAFSSTSLHFNSPPSNPQH